MYKCIKIDKHTSHVSITTKKKIMPLLAHNILKKVKYMTQQKKVLAFTGLG
jgi:hypothetical protein